MYHGWEKRGGAVAKSSRRANRGVDAQLNFKSPAPVSILTHRFGILSVSIRVSSVAQLTYSLAINTNIEWAATVKSLPNVISGP